MRDFRFKSSQRAISESPYRRLVAVVLSSTESGCSNRSLCPSQVGTIGCSSVQYSLAVSGLEEALSAALETTEVIRQAWGARTDVQKANVEASAAAVRQVEQLAQILRECSLRQLIQAEYAHLSRLRLADDAQRLLD